MRFSHQLLTLWYGTSDAPAPIDGAVTPRHRASALVAVQPPHPENVVTVHYRVDAGRLQSVRAVRVGSPPPGRVEYHRVTFPDFWNGERVDYLPVLHCAGRQVPDIATASTLPSSFRLAQSRPHVLTPLLALPAHELAPVHEKLPFSLDYLASIRVPLRQPELIGVTPEGITVNWFWSPAEGTVAGPHLNGKVRSIGGDWMTIRRDGVGVMDVRATIETTDGALLYVHYLGNYELGATGYQDFLDHRWPARATTRTTPRFHTSHSSYLWLNRVQCLGIGEVRIAAQPTYNYDLYAVQ